MGEGQPHFFEMFFYDRCETLKREGGAKLSGLDHHIEKVCQAFKISLKFTRMKNDLNTDKVQCSNHSSINPASKQKDKRPTELINLD